MSAIARKIGLSNDSSSVTKISAHARIDYILRFSKQAILVIDESIEQNTPISGQFLDGLPEQYNAAYISLSGQFNNIQIRCRIIEQLYSGELFDPEISLAVSVTNLAKKSQQAISIVLDNTQYLSLQILHELSQLASIAKKANLKINVVMFGSVQAGKTVAENKNLFDNKLTLLSAQTGQLLSTTSALFKKNRPTWYFIIHNKWLLGSIVLLLALTGMVIKLLQQDSFNFAQPLVTNQQEKISLTNALTEPQTTVISDSNDILHKEINQPAATEDIFSALVTSAPKKTIDVPTEIASPSEIISAINLTGTNEGLLAGESTQGFIIEQPIQKIKNQVASTKPITADNNYYLSKAGYAIQIAVFSDLNLPPTFLANLALIDFHIYQRLLNNKKVMVITSSIYDDISKAKSALANLPSTLKARQPWIKPVTVINNEISVFLDSQ